MAVRTLWKFVVGRAKTFIKNYNVIERAEKVVENDKRTAPRHPGTEAKFKVLIKERPDIQDDVDKKQVELLDRLKIVKVSSEDGVQDDQTENKPLPQIRHRHELPAFGYEEPKTISEGKCTLRQALEFISNHQNDPSTHNAQSIADAYKMKSSDVEQVIENFRAFQIFIAPNEKRFGVSKKTWKILGVSRVVHPLYDPKFDEIEDEAVEENKSTPDKK